MIRKVKKLIIITLTNSEFKRLSFNSLLKSDSTVMLLTRKD